MWLDLIRRWHTKPSSSPLPLPAFFVRPVLFELERVGFVFEFRQARDPRVAATRLGVSPRAALKRSGLRSFSTARANAASSPIAIASPVTSSPAHGSDQVVPLFTPHKRTSVLLLQLLIH